MPISNEKDLVICFFCACFVFVVLLVILQPVKLIMGVSTSKIEIKEVNLINKPKIEYLPNGKSKQTYVNTGQNEYIKEYFLLRKIDMVCEYKNIPMAICFNKKEYFKESENKTYISYCKKYMKTVDNILTKYFHKNLNCKYENNIKDIINSYFIDNEDIITQNWSNFQFIMKKYKLKNKYYFNKIDMEIPQDIKSIIYTYLVYNKMVLEG